MALVLEGKRRCCFVLPGRGINAPSAGSGTGAAFHASREIQRLQSGYPVCGEAMEVLGGIGYCEEVNSPAVSRDAGEQHLGSSETSCVWMFCVPGEAARYVRSAGRGFAQVKVRTDADRSWQRLQQKLRKPQEAQGGRLRIGCSCWAPEARCCGTPPPSRRRGAA